MSGLACIEIGSIALGYACLARLCETNVELVEASASGAGRMLILLRGSASDLTECVRLVERLAIEAPGWDSEVLAQEPQGLIDSVYSLGEQRLDEALIVCETASMSAMLAAADALMSSAVIRAIEIRPSRGSSGGAFGMFTGNKANCSLLAEGARSRLRSADRVARVEVVSNLNEKFRQMFHLDGCS